MLVRVRHGARENKYCPISTKASTSASYTEDINSSFILGSSSWLWTGYFLHPWCNGSIRGSNPLGECSNRSGCA